ncbi:MAG: glutathione S-transferase family protein [Polyangiaceae bacterium]|nr:glutathione S-transferase family protein [Polyangiaceae bacterium]
MQLTGRSSSHFTRVVRIVAHELGVPVTLVPVFDLTQVDADCYGDNPTLKIPMLRESVDGEPLFGTMNICRRLAEHAAERSGKASNIIWPETLTTHLSRNASELVWHAMAAQVQLVFGTGIGKLDADNIFFLKGKRGFEGSLAWLESHLESVLEELPSDRLTSLCEVALFCVLDHIQWRETLPLEAYPRLRVFAQEFATRESARATAYQFDVPPAS